MKRLGGISIRVKATFVSLTLIILFAAPVYANGIQSNPSSTNTTPKLATRCTCSINIPPAQVVVNTNQNTQPLFGTITDKFILPFIVAVTTFLLLKKYDDYVKRRQYSILGIAIIDSLLEEVQSGLAILQNQQELLLPVKSWDGMSTIPDDVLLRIIATSKNVQPRHFPPKEIRIHCKNYFEHMSASWKNALSSNFRQDDMQRLVTDGHFDQAAQGVITMLNQCKEFLELNAKRIFPK